jgi:hypothetical protein
MENSYQSFSTIPTAENFTALKQCRYCLDFGNQADIIMPCNCIGTSMWVHRECLNKWRSSTHIGDRFDRCEICLANYEYEPYEETKRGYYMRKIKHVMYVSWDLFLFILATQLAILAFAMIMFVSGGAAKLSQKLHSSEFVAAYLFGVLSLFVMIGIIGFVISLSDRNSGSNFCFLNNSEGNCIVWLTILILITVCGIIIGTILFFGYLKHVLTKRAIQSRLYLDTSIKRVKDRSSNNLVNIV